MELAANTRHRRDIHKIFAAALHAADAGRAVERVLRRDGDVLFVGDGRLPLEAGGRLLLASAGKSAGVMARAAATVVGPLLTAGVAVGASGNAKDIPGVRFVPGDHPIPGDRSLTAGAAILELASEAGPADVLLFLLSGGASAMLEQPLPGITLDDLQAITEALLKSGAPIAEINTARKALSVVKAGGIARAAAPAFVQTLAVSDVVGDSPSVIGSAPTVAAVADPAHALEILRRCDLPVRVEAAVHEALMRRAQDDRREGQPSRGTYRVIASVANALAGAVHAALLAGYETDIVSNKVVGEAREVGASWARRARAAHDAAHPRCLLAGGETTVRVVGDGRGGRNQEFTLAAGIGLAGAADVTVAAVGTDGRDGPTNAAGAIADGETVERGRRSGNEAAGFLADNDSYTFFAELDDLVVTGPTRTNVMDMHIALMGLPDD